MMMQHKDIKGEPIDIRPYAEFKQDKARREMAIRIHQSSMAMKRIADDYPHLSGWICLAVRDRCEFAVEKLLIDGGVDVLLPRRRSARSVNRGRVRQGVVLPVIPGYLLVRCAIVPAAMMALARVEGVLDIVGGMERPYRIRAQEVEKFRYLAEEGAYDEREVSCDYLVDEVVLITDGPFASFNGVVVDIEKAGKGRLIVEANIFGRSTPLELDVAQIEKL